MATPRTTTEAMISSSAPGNGAPAIPAIPPATIPPTNEAGADHTRPRGTAIAATTPTASIASR
ncbi:hypothetical protein D3C83_294180 [compost metagenome]